MKLVTFTVENFRSIKKAYKIGINPTKTVLVGPNNEGKSNLLKAFALGLNFLLSSPDEFRMRGHYSWESDYPLDLQANNPDGASIVEYEFELDQKEKSTFRNITGSTWDSTLKIRLTFKRSRPEVEIKTKGKAKKTVNQKQEKILDFLRKHLIFHSVPAVRTADLTRRLISRLVFQELAAQKKSKEYLELQNQLEKLEAPILKALAEKTKEHLREFSTSCDSVTFHRDSGRYSSGEAIDLIINDGVATSLEAKGDGVQSLVAIAMIVLTSEAKAQGKSQFCTIEEPESHLHPKAVHEVTAAINKIATNVQTIITTHSPLLVDRDSVSRNIIVENGRAEPAKSISHLRDVLGIQRSDNLELARVALLCEGDSDKIILDKWLRDRSKPLKDAIENGTLIIISIRGIGKLEYQLNLYNGLLCSTHVFADYDKPAKEKVEAAIRNKRLGHADYNYAKISGFKESEIEDLLPLDIYAPILGAYGVDLTQGEFKNKTKKWTTRIEDLFGKVGKAFPDSLESEIKNKIAEAVEKSTVTLKPEGAPIVESLVTSLESKLNA